MTGVLAAALCLAASSPAESQVEPCAVIAPASPISEIGVFSDMRYTEEHAYGHTLWLSRAGQCVFGILGASQGLAADTPIGELRDVTLNPDTGDLAFSARLTMGVTSVPGTTSFQPSRNLFRFQGRLLDSRVVGEFTHVNQADRTPVPVVIQVVLTKSGRDAGGMREPATYGAWREKWQPILASRGPKW